MIIIVALMSRPLWQRLTKVVQSGNKLMMKQLHNTWEQFLIECEQIDEQDSDSRQPPQKRRKCNNLRLPDAREAYLKGVEEIVFRAKLCIVKETDESYCNTLGMLFGYCRRNVKQKILMNVTVEEVLGWEEIEEGQKIAISHDWQVVLVIPKTNFEFF